MSSGANLNGVGGIVLGSGDIEFNVGRPVTKLKVRNTGDRPVQIGSHFHFFEVNRAIEFDREKAFGQHLNIPSSTGIRLEPGAEQEVELVPYGGKQCVYGFNNLVENWAGASVYNPARAEAVAKAAALGFKSTKK
ncbi:MAG: urease subunit beta [Pseudomonadota bacterium]|nr:urease subunit beta [Pseudomonadota bacterium]